MTRRSLLDAQRNEPLHEALRWVNAAFVGDPQDVRTWPTLDPLSPHARAVVAFADAAGITDPTATLMNNLAQLLDAKSSLGEAEPLMRRALAIALEFERQTGFEHPHQQLFSTNYRTLLQEVGKSDSEIEAALAALAHGKNGE